MNDYDSAKLSTLLKENGYSIVETTQEADFIIVNTCSVRKTAEDRALAFLSSQKPLKKEGKKLCLFGCSASLYREKLFKKYPFIDIICSPDNYKNVPNIFKTGKKGCYVEENLHPFLETTPLTNKTLSALVTVTKGCENFCSYCVVPFTRGKLISRQPEEILNEIKKLTENGINEIILLGQNVNEYGKDIGTTFIDLLKKIDSMEGVARISFTTSHPKDISDELLALFAQLPKLYKHLHLPFQSGSNKILKLMNRKYTIEQYLGIIKKVRDIYPQITITSDIIVGFPGEDEKDFQDTSQIVKTVEFDDLFIFKYSARPGTVAALMKETVTSTEKETRHKFLISLQNEISYKKNQGYIGETLSVFLRNVSEKKNGVLIGRTITNKPVFVKSSKNNLGKVCQVKITDAHRMYLLGDCCDANRNEKILSEPQV
jgi:tRNA-2-methylthio-N6-dimethylallyladenosine synthase